MEINLDAARAARAEANGEHNTVTFGGQVFDLPVECPYTFAEALNRDDPQAMLHALLGADDAARFLALGPTVPDLTELVVGVARVYGLGAEGNSAASNGSSKSGSRRSKRIS